MTAMVAVGRNHIPTSEIRCRDPFITVDTVGKAYYLIVSKRGPNNARLFAYKSTDLKYWDEMGYVYYMPSDYPCPDDWWAPDTYYYKGKYYCFVTVRGAAKNILRGVTILRSDKGPLGPYKSIIPKDKIFITPAGTQCLDGSLYVDEAGTPWILYAVEWCGPNVKDKVGEVWCQQLTEDLTSTVGEPVKLFAANESGWSKNTGGYVTDAPFAFRDDKSGNLLMLWSSFSPRYSIGQAVSQTGKLTGPWTHEKQMIFSKDGGHQMVFRDLQGNLKISFHSPNSKTETLTISDIEIKDGKFQPLPAMTYDVSVNGKAQAVHIAKCAGPTSNYFFSSCDFTGSASVKVSSVYDMRSAKLVYPKTRLTKRESSASFTSAREFIYSLEHDGRNTPLLLFGNTPDKYAKSVKEGDAGVIYYGAGDHYQDHIVLHSHQTLYLAEGAIVHGAVWATGDSITICGRGILSGDMWESDNAPARYMILADRCSHLTISGITLSNTWGNAVVLSNSDGVTIDRVKVCGARMTDDDALDICNSRNVTVTNSFFRSNGSNIAVRGVDRKYLAYTDKWSDAREIAPAAGRTDTVPDIDVSENITVSDCALWSDRSSNIMIGRECGADTMSGIKMSDMLVMHTPLSPGDMAQDSCRAVVHLLASNGMNISDGTFNKFDIYGDIADVIAIRARSSHTSGPDSDFQPYTTAGSMDSITFSDFRLISSADKFDTGIYLEGASAEEDLDKIALNNIRLLSENITWGSSLLTVKDFVNYSLNGTPVGIEKVRSGRNAGGGEMIFTTDGVRVPSEVKGVNIIRKADGSTKKKVVL